MTKKLSRAPADKPTARTKKKEGSDPATLPLTWSATEYSSRKRWWWYVGLILVSLWLCALAVYLHIWSLLAVILASAVAFIVLYSSQPKIWHYRLTTSELQVKHQDRELVFALQQYRAFTVEEIQRKKGDEPYVLLSLLPRGRFGSSRDVYLTDDLDQNLGITERLTLILPFEEAPGHWPYVKFIDRLARLLRL